MLITSLVNFKAIVSKQRNKNAFEKDYKNDIIHVTGVEAMFSLVVVLIYHSLFLLREIVVERFDKTAS